MNTDVNKQLPILIFATDFNSRFYIILLLKDITVLIKITRLKQKLTSVKVLFSREAF